MYVEHAGNSKVPRGYRAKDGYKLGHWVGNQRQKRAQLTSGQISKLDAVGFDWDPLKTQWEEGFSHLEKYVEHEGHALVAQNYLTEDGCKLGIWVSGQRSKKDQLSPDHLSRLDLLGFDWDPFKTQWEEGFSYLEQYVEHEGNSKVPRGYRTTGGYKLGSWVGKQRQKRVQLTSGQISKLDAVGFDWDPRKTLWEEGFSHLEKYVVDEGHALVPHYYKTADGYNLGNWVRKQRYKRDQLSPDQIAKLDSLGFVWKVKK